MTGDTENGRVDQRDQDLLAAEVELRDGPRRGDAEDRVHGTTIAAVVSVSLIAAIVSGARNASR